MKRAAFAVGLLSLAAVSCDGLEPGRPDPALTGTRTALCGLACPDGSQSCGCYTLLSLGGVNIPIGAISGPNLVMSTVTLSQTAAADTTISLSTDDTTGLISIPASVLVPAGSASGNFTVNVTRAVPTDTTVTVTATDGTSQATDTLIVLATPPLANGGFTLVPYPVTAGATVTATLALTSPAPVGGATVEIAPDNPAANIPTPEKIPAGQSSLTFTFTAGAVTSTTNVNVTATTNIGGVQIAVMKIEPAPPPTAIVNCPVDFILPPSDDYSSGQVSLPFTANFFGGMFTYLYINTNGNLTFGGPLTDYTPFHLGSSATPIIAPFFADVQTAGGANGEVDYGIASFAKPGDSLCVTWNDVGYYDNHLDKRNKFQVLLVDQSTAPGGYPGDFDIIFNYEKLQWETGDQSGGINGLGGYSAVAGYSNASGHFSELAGSLVPGSFLDGSGTSLSGHSGNSTVLGRWIFPVRAGVAPAPSGTVVGLITSGSTPSIGPPLVGAPIQVCPAAGGACVLLTKTGDNGRFVAGGIPEGDYVITAFPPTNMDLVVTNKGVHVTKGQTSQVDIALPSAVGIPSGTTLEPYRSLTNGVPTVHYQDALTLRAAGCVGGTASYTITDPGYPILHGNMTESPAGEYSAYVGQLYPTHGTASVEIDIICKLVPQKPIKFNIYIDPSGRVLTPFGVPVFGAAVTLLRSDTPSGPFTVVPDGSEIMSPGNRANPSYASVDGQFGWDVISGYYVVRASRTGCTSPSGAPYAESAVLTIPPAVIDLDLRLSCPDLDDTQPPVSTATLSPDPGPSGWSRGPELVTITAKDDRSGVKDITYSLSGAQTGGATVAGSVAAFTVSAEGVTTLSWYARDTVGNVEQAHTMEIRIDGSRPTLTCKADPAVLWPPNHRLIPIHVDVQVSDDGSGPGTLALSSVTSSEPDDGTGDGDTTGDIQGWSLGTADVDGLLRAERSGQLAGRTYTLTYEATDRAGNAATCSTTVFVPKNQ